jgi:hypothetical protein
MTLKKTRDIARPQRRWVEVNLSGARFQNVDLTGATLRGVTVVDVEIDGFVRNLTVNGVDVGPLVDAELDRRHPERVLLRSHDPAEIRRGWAVVAGGWRDATARIQRLPAGAALEQVDSEWSFAETLRHLVFVTDAWLSRPVLGARNHYWPGGLGTTDTPAFVSHACGLDPRAAPTFDVLAARAERQATVSQFLDEVTADELTRQCKGNRSPGYPANTRALTVGRALQVVLNEEATHLGFAERDLMWLER